MNALDELKAAVKGDSKLEGLVKEEEQMYILTGKKLAKLKKKCTSSAKPVHQKRERR